MALAAIVPASSGCAPPTAGSQAVAYDLARERVLKLAPLMSQAEVQSLLGPPDQTRAELLGGAPWAAGSMGQVWTYEWKSKGLETKRLVVSFGLIQGRGWCLSSWSWS